MNELFIEKFYNPLVRPNNPETGLTDIYIELKLLQIQLVYIIL
jgi:hypothetical protein